MYRKQLLYRRAVCVRPVQLQVHSAFSGWLPLRLDPPVALFQYGYVYVVESISMVILYVHISGRSNVFNYMYIHFGKHPFGYLVSTCFGTNSGGYLTSACFGTH